MRLTPVVLLAAVGASAHPSRHAHLHRDVHHVVEKKDVTWVTATINGDVVSWTIGGDAPYVAAYKPTTTSTTAAATTTAVANAAVETTTSSSSTTTAAAASTTAASSSSSETGTSTYVSFDDCSSSKVKKTRKRATTAEISYTGNTGTCGYGTNIKLITGSIASEYSYVVKAVNDGSESMECMVWNKIGEDGAIDGFFKGNEAATFTLDSGSYQHIAFDADTQGGMCCVAGGMTYTTYGEFLCPWLEFDFADAANDDWSGFDASALVEASVGGPYGALEVCTEDESVCSSLDTSGGGDNAYLEGDEAEDGIGGNLAAGDVTLIATWS